MTLVSLVSPAPRLHVGQGEHHVSSDPAVMLTTVLGSCVSMCLRDPTARVGGMNHFLLPDGMATCADTGRRYGAYAMELLINGVLNAGGRRERLEAKLFGGGRMFDSLQDVGRFNADFAERFLSDEGIPVIGGSLRGLGARRINFWPATGRALQRTVVDQLPQMRPVRPLPADGAVELF